MTSKVTYNCEDCGIEINGRSGDPQESPELFCPDCGDMMNFDVDWHAG